MLTFARTTPLPLTQRMIVRIALVALMALMAFGAAQPAATKAATGSTPLPWGTGTTACTVDYNRSANTLLVSPPTAKTNIFGPTWNGTVEGWTQLFWRPKGTSSWIPWGSPIYHGKMTINANGAASFPGTTVSRSWTMGSTPGDAAVNQYLNFVPKGGTPTATGWQLLTGFTTNTYYRGSTFPTVTRPNPTWLCTFP